MAERQKMPPILSLPVHITPNATADHNITAKERRRLWVMIADWMMGGLYIVFIAGVIAYVYYGVKK